MKLLSPSSQSAESNTRAHADTHPHSPQLPSSFLTDVGYTVELGFTFPNCPLSLWRLLYKNLYAAILWTPPSPFHTHFLLYPWPLFFQLSQTSLTIIQSSHRGWKGIRKKPTVLAFRGWDTSGAEGRCGHAPPTHPLPALQTDTKSILRSISFKVVGCLEKDQAKNLGPWKKQPGKL